MAKCPQCKHLTKTFILEPVIIKDRRHKWDGVSYNCPLCGCVVTVTIDPFAMRDEIVSTILEAVRKD